MKTVKSIYELTVLAEERKVIKVDFLYGKHVEMWNILSEWEGDGANPFERGIYTDLKKQEVIEKIGYGDKIHSFFACHATENFKKINRHTLNSCYICPLEWTDTNGNRCSHCTTIYHKWREAEGKEKKRLAKMISNMPLADDAKLFYNIVR